MPKKQYEHDFEIRRYRNRRRTRRLRSRRRLGRHGRQHVPGYNGHEQNRPDELQPGRGRHCKGTDCKGNRRAGRTDGSRHRRHSHTVPHAQPLERPGRMEPTRPVRPRQVHLAVALRARPHRPPRHLAGPGRGAHCGTRARRGRKDRVGRGAARKERSADGGHLPQRPAAHRA